MTRLLRTAALWCSAAALLSTAAALPHQRTVAPDTTVVVRAVTLAFEPSELAFKQGSRVRVRFINAGTLPHNLVVVRQEDDIDPLAEAAAQQGGTYVPLALKERMLAWTKLASPGDTVETEFVVPPPGVYPFVCLFTGHTNMMLGSLRSLR